jgi:catechol 2,3-dioxygenase-like lactoylglutathione lyase family enzyme
VLIRGLHHVQLAAPPGCEVQARRFYGEILGLREIAKPANLAARGGAWFRGEAFEIHIGVEQEFRPARKAHVALEVSDLAAVRVRLVAQGVSVVDDEPLPGFMRFYASDPFGNRLEFLQPLGDAADAQVSAPPPAE